MSAIADFAGSADVQAQFVRAIFFDAAPTPAAISAPSSAVCASRFGVYRNNVVASLTNALAARYPMVRKLLWDDAFHRIARLYVTAEPPRSPVLFEYGESFPQFIRAFGRNVAAEYLADVARLEAARTRAYHAADAQPVGKKAFAALSPERLAGLRVQLHPSVVLLQSRFPMVSIWESNQDDGGTRLSEWRPESALVARPDLDVEVWRLPAGGYEFLSALSQGRSIAASVEQATANAVDFDLTASMTTLVKSNIVVGLLRYGSARRSWRSNHDNLF